MTERVEVLDGRAEALIDETTDFMEALRAIRKEHGLSQEAVAALMGVSQSAVSQFEHYDANPTLSTIRRYAMAVGARLRLEVTDDYVQPKSVATLSVKAFSAPPVATSTLGWANGGLIPSAR